MRVTKFTKTKLSKMLTLLPDLALDQDHKNKIVKNANSTTRSSAGNAKSLKGGQPSGIREVPAGKL